MGDVSYSESILAKFQKKKRKQPEAQQNWKTKHAEVKEKKRKREEEKEMKKLQKKIDAEKKVKDATEKIEAEKKEKGRDWTISIAVPGCIIDKAQSDVLKTYLAGQIARTAAIYCVDEIVVYDESKSTTRNEDGEFISATIKKRNGCIMLGKILQYLECPQYLRKAFFPAQPDLQFAGVLNPLEIPHHLKADQWCNYREGVVNNKPVKEGRGSYVDIGLKKDCRIDKCLQTGVRVTVKIDPESKELKNYRGVAVAPTEPRTQCGMYWGYKLRLATCLSEVFNLCPYEGGYDATIGVSPKGDSIDRYDAPSGFRHMLVVFGGIHGLEASVESDDKLSVTEPRGLFTAYLNPCPNPGTSSIRAEESMMVTLCSLRPKIYASQNKS